MHLDEESGQVVAPGGASRWDDACHRQPQPRQSLQGGRDTGAGIAAGARGGQAAYCSAETRGKTPVMSETLKMIHGWDKWRNFHHA